MWQLIRCQLPVANKPVKSLGVYNNRTCGTKKSWSSCVTLIGSLEFRIWQGNFFDWVRRICSEYSLLIRCQLPVANTPLKSLGNVTIELAPQRNHDHPAWSWLAVWNFEFSRGFYYELFWLGPTNLFEKIDFFKKFEIRKINDIFAINYSEKNLDHQSFSKNPVVSKNWCSNYRGSTVYIIVYSTYPRVLPERTWEFCRKIW